MEDAALGIDAGDRGGAHGRAASPLIAVHVFAVTLWLAGCRESCYCPSWLQWAAGCEPDSATIVNVLSAGQRVAAGGYLYVLSTGDWNRSQRMVLVK